MSILDLVFIFLQGILISLVNGTWNTGHKMQLHLLLLSILGLAVATPVGIFKISEAFSRPDALVLGRNNALENVVLGLLEDLRHTMLAGSDDVPVLDPLEVEHVHLNEAILSLPGSHLDVKDLKVTQLSTFVVDTLTINSVSLFPVRYSLDFDIHIPVLEVEAVNYDLLASVAGTNIFGNGDAKIDLIEPRVKGSLVVGPRVTITSGIFLQITSSHVQASLKGFESQINGLMNDTAMSDFINTFLRHFVPGLLDVHEDEITKLLSDTVLEVGNEILADLNLSGILG